MNIENVVKLRNFLKNVPQNNFDHTFWEGSTDDTETEVVLDTGEHVCGTTACIGGWAAIIGNLVPYSINEKHEIVFEDIWNKEFFAVSRDWLGLGESDAVILFAPFDLDWDNFPSHYDDEMEEKSRAYLSDTTVDEAVQFLDRMIEASHVNFDWWFDIKDKEFNS